MHPVITELLRKRGITEPADIEEYLSPRPKMTFDPYEMKGMNDAVEIISQYLSDGKRICIYGDYDVDGITSVSLLYGFLSELTDNVTYYIPSRFSEGYGLNINAADSIIADGTDLVITVDCGCVSNLEVAHLRKNGVEVIVTDHHNVDERIPDCVVIDAKQDGETYPYRDLCGCGVAFKLAQALSRRREIPRSSYLRHLDIVGIATIADIVPLTGENRTLVKYSFDSIAKGKRPGLAKLIEEISLDRRNLSATNISFGIAPHINATGRMKHANIAVRLLTADSSTDTDEIDSLIEEIKSLNDERKSIQSKIFDDACAYIESMPDIPPFIIYDAGDAHEGVTGIVAGKLKEKYYRPVVVLTNAKNHELYKGTGRSIPGADLHAILSESIDLFTRFGGHAAACGFTLPKKNKQKLIESTDKIMKKLIRENPKIIENQLNYDMELPSEYINLKLAKELTLLEPCGKGNEYPVFLIKNVTLLSKKTIGKNGAYRSFRCVGEDGTAFKAVWFDVDRKIDYYLDEGSIVDLIAELSINKWRGTESAQCTVRQIILHK